MQKDIIKTFIYNIQYKINNQKIKNLKNLTDIKNPVIIKHKR